VPSAIIRPGYVFTRWIQWKMTNSEVARTMEGTICATSRALTMTTVTRKRYFAKRIGRWHRHDQGQHSRPHADDETRQHVARLRLDHRPVVVKCGGVRQPIVRAADRVSVDSKEPTMTA